MYIFVCPDIIFWKKRKYVYKIVYIMFQNKYVRLSVNMPWGVLAIILDALKYS